MEESNECGIERKKDSYFKNNNINNFRKSYYNPRSCAKIAFFSAVNDFNNTLKFNQHVQHLEILREKQKSKMSTLNSQIVENMTTTKKI